MTSNQVSDEISIPLARISNAYENWKCAPEERKAFHAATIRRELAGAGAALTTLQEMFGDVNSGNQARFTNAQMVETAKDAGGCLVMPAPKKDNEIVIEKSARGYRFTLPEWCAPSPNVISGFKVPSLGIGYHTPIDGTPYRLFPTEKLNDIVHFLSYWFVEPYTGGLNRNGGKVCTVRVAQ